MMTKRNVVYLPILPWRGDYEPQWQPWSKMFSRRVWAPSGPEFVVFVKEYVLRHLRLNAEKFIKKVAG
jgi:hypothetical protein